ncbi:hypothetical protein ESB00_01855 [Oleiharenicola lentus]|jgi:branched-subunit amino acid permease|uniref:Uncharacterized protein n=1 Tax=Oleiharenicola lentus TaxID=2508720 RepID=A0A4Q1C6Z2_9BACT|nr:hypothetical protein [Oleiharenicola lentus]RXK54665.1 hypothetical protein ESB00_01855 [Oleiharenicola lentus]
MIPDHEGSLVSQVRAQATPAACRRFGFTLLLGLPLAGLVWLCVLRFTTGRWVWPVFAGFVLAALLLGVSALLAAGWARRLYIGWHTVTRAIEALLTWFVLAVLFWLVISPVGLVRRRKASAFKSVPGKSYWQDVPPVKDPSRYYRQF